MPIHIEKDHILVILGARDVGVAEVSNMPAGMGFIQLDRSYKKRETLPLPDDIPEPFRSYPKVFFRFDNKGGYATMASTFRKLGKKLGVKGINDSVGDRLFDNFYEEIGEHQDRMRRVVHAVHEAVPASVLENALGMSLEEFCEAYSCNTSILKVKQNTAPEVP